MADVTGTTKTANPNGGGLGIDVSKASYDPGYPFGESLPSEFNQSDLKIGYSESNKVVGNT